MEHIDRKTPKPTDDTKLVEWKTHDARIISWTLNSFDPHIILNLRPYKTDKGMFCPAISTGV